LNIASLNASWRLASLSNKVLLTTNLCLGVAVLILGGAAVNQRDRVVVMPPTIDAPYALGWSSATPEYLKSMALYFTGVIGSLNPRTVEYVIKVIDTFCDPSVAQEIKRRLRAIAADYEFRQSTASNWFEAEKLAWEQKSGKVFVIGRLVSVNTGNLSSSKQVIYEYKIDIREGQPRITHFDSYEGSTPHTLEWASNPKKIEAENKRLEREAKSTSKKEDDLNVREANQSAITEKQAPKAPEGGR
jgi:conjugal transfer pilus assembly protein TraE